MGRRGAKEIYICIFKNTLFNIRTSIYDFFVAECLFALPKASGCAHVAWSWHIHRQRKNKVTRSDVLTFKLLQE